MPPKGFLVPFPIRESLSWPPAVGALNLVAQTFALVVVLFSLLFGRDLFSHSALVVAVLEPTGLLPILLVAILARHDPKLKHIREHVTQVETPPGRPGPPG